MQRTVLERMNCYTSKWIVSMQTGPIIPAKSLAIYILYNSSKSYVL